MNTLRSQSGARVLRHSWIEGWPRLESDRSKPRGFPRSARSNPGHPIHHSNADRELARVTDSIGANSRRQAGGCFGISRLYRFLAPPRRAAGRQASDYAALLITRRKYRRILDRKMELQQYDATDCRESSCQQSSCPCPRDCAAACPSQRRPLDRATYVAPLAFF